MKKMTLVFTLFVILTSLNADIVRDNKKNIVKDTSTGLMWQDEVYSKQEENAYENGINYGKAGKWEYAKRYCDNLNFSGLSDWRLPTIDELKSIVDKNRKPAIKKGFINANNRFYWSSSSFISIASHAGNVHFFDGSSGWQNKRASHYIRCVRM